MKKFFIQFTRCCILAGLLILLIQPIVTTPSLAWFDCSGPDFQPARCKGFTLRNYRIVTERSADQLTAQDVINWGTPEYPWTLARAE